MPIVKVKDNRRGTALIEAALILPVLLLITLGAIEYSYYFWASAGVNLAARAGARAAVLPSATDTTIQTAVSTTMTNYGLPVATCTYTNLGVASGQMITATVKVPTSVVDISGLMTLLKGSSTDPTSITSNVTMAKEGP